MEYYLSEGGKDVTCPLQDQRKNEAPQFCTRRSYLIDLCRFHVVAKSLNVVLKNIVWWFQSSIQFFVKEKAIFFCVWSQKATRTSIHINPHGKSTVGVCLDAYFDFWIFCFQKIFLIKLDTIYHSEAWFSSQSHQCQLFNVRQVAHHLLCW